MINKSDDPGLVWNVPFLSQCATPTLQRTNPILGIYCPQNLEEVNIYIILVAENSIGKAMLTSIMTMSRLTPCSSTFTSWWRQEVARQVSDVSEAADATPPQSRRSPTCKWEAEVSSRHLKMLRPYQMLYRFVYFFWPSVIFVFSEQWCNIVNTFFAFFCKRSVLSWSLSIFSEKSYVTYCFVVGCYVPKTDNMPRQSRMP